MAKINCGGSTGLNGVCASGRYPWRDRAEYDRESAVVRKYGGEVIGMLGRLAK